MKFQTQTKLHDPRNGIRGNCMMACYASYFDITIDEVPAIEELFDGPPGFWYMALEMWLSTYCQRKEVRHFKSGRPIDPSLSGHDDYYFACGPSPRGVQHMVIYKNGELVHDPHPSRAGLLEVNEFITLEKI